MKILGIESSCDDTSVALVDCTAKGCFVISEKTASQIDIHKKYGGVVPEIAGRMHAEKIVPLIEEVLKGHGWPQAIAVASGPGLVTGLLVGTTAARALSLAKKIPLISVNHIEGHIFSVILPIAKKAGPKIKYPALALVVSGGHTEIISIKKPGQYKLLGATRDDAAGECFDKVAKLLGLSYPGGPQISKLALRGNPKAIKFPRPMSGQINYDFSFAGLKTSALYYHRDHPKTKLADFCASLEQAIVDVLTEKTFKAITKFQPKSLILAGGVSANKKLRETLKKTAAKKFPKINFLCPEPAYCMDNAAMIAAAGYEKFRQKKFTPWRKLKPDPNWELAK